MGALWLAALALGPWQAGATGNNGGPPAYTAASIANSASNIANYYAPNMFISIYGQNLAYVTKAISAADISGGILPTALIGTGVRVLINQIPADIWYVSPTLVNALVPISLVAGPAVVQLEADGVAGPAITIMLQATAPSLFQIDATTVLGTLVDGSLITSSAPAHAGELIILYATGLGPTVPAAVPNQVPTQAAPLVKGSDFQILLNGVQVAPDRVFYAGVTPTCAGLFQINFTLPDDAPPNPEIQIGSDGNISPPGRYLPLQ